jgi:hypothetical protein
VQGGVLVAACPKQVRGDDHLVVEAEHRVVEVHGVQPDLDAGGVEERVEEVQRVADASGQGAAHLLEVVAFGDVWAVGVGEGEPDTRAVGALGGEALHRVGQQFQHERVGVAEQIDTCRGAGQQGGPQFLRDVGAVGVGADDLGGRDGAGVQVGAGLRPQVSLGLAQHGGHGQAGALVRDPAAEPAVDGLDVHSHGGSKRGRIVFGAQHRGA